MPQPKDTFEFGRAKMLAKRIQDWWLARGHIVNVYTEPMREGDTTLYVVRSNLLNALPPVAS
jgi:hypothetical protein